MASSSPQAPHAYLAYLLALLPLLVIVTPSILFDFYLRSRGSLAAPAFLADRAAADPRLTTQVVAFCGALLASGVKFGLNRAFTLTARKRFAKYRTLFELENWISFTNGWMVLPVFSPWRRWRAMLTSIILLIVRGLLTSTFVSLLAPLPIQVTDIVTGDAQLDLSGNSATCEQWSSSQMASTASCNGTVQFYKNFTYQSCTSSQAHFLDLLDAGKASMLHHVMKAVESPYPKVYVSRYGKLANTRILGSTAGVIPMGPSGLKAFSGLLGPNNVSIESRLSNASYSLFLQGIWAEVNCQYTNVSEGIAWPPTKSRSDQYSLELSCPSGLTSTSESSQLPVPSKDGLLFAHACADASNTVYSYYLRSLFGFHPDNSTSLDDSQSGTNRAYAGIGGIKCTVRPQLRNIRASLDPVARALVMSPTDEDPSPWKQPLQMFSTLSARTVQALNNGSLLDSGNLVASVIDVVADSRYKLPVGEKNEKYPALVASMIKGIFEYEATHLRLVSTMAVESAPANCKSVTTGTVSYPMIGWNHQPSSTLALIPLGIVAGLTLIFAVWPMLRKSKLMVFDPTSPVSLIATASAGGLHLNNEEVSNLHGNGLRSVKVRYGHFKDKHGTDRWGLVQKQRS